MSNTFDVIKNRQAEVQVEPFRHVVVDDFFTPEFYRDLCKEFKRVLLLGLSESSSRKIFGRFSHYDAYSWSIDPALGYPLNFFYSREWKNYISDIFGIRTSDDISASFHHHLVGSQSGFIHNDFNLCSFKKNPLPNRINPWYHQCIYTDDSPHLQPDTIKRMRAIVLIYFLLNDQNWREGDGGETGFYVKDKETLVKKVPPLNNRLMAFEIGPFSFHAFLKNHKVKRNSIIQWFHQEPELTMERYGVLPREKWRK